MTITVIQAINRGSEQTGGCEEGGPLLMVGVGVAELGRVIVARVVVAISWAPLAILSLRRRVGSSARKIRMLRKPDGTIVTVKRPISVAARSKPGTSPTDATEPTSAKLEPPTAAPTEISKAQVTNNDTKVAETLAIKPDKRKISLSWLGKEEKPTTSSDEKAETPKAPFAKLPQEKTVATASIPNIQTTSEHHTIASKIGLKEEMEGAAAVGLAATGLVLHEPNTAHTAEQEAEKTHHAVSKDTLNNTGDSRYSRNNNNDSEMNAAMDSGGTNDPEAYDDWYSDDEEVDPNDIGGGDDSLDTPAVDAGESGPAAVLSAPEDDGADDIEDFNPDTDELFDDEVDPSGSAIYDGTSSQALDAGASGPAVDSSILPT
ncbi:hypothetical protein V8E51_013632 [Hyaloscypha variabilis]